MMESSERLLYLMEKFKDELAQYHNPTPPPGWVQQEVEVKLLLPEKIPSSNHFYSVLDLLFEPSEIIEESVPENINEAETDKSMDSITSEPAVSVKHIPRDAKEKQAPTTSSSQMNIPVYITGEKQRLPEKSSGTEKSERPGPSRREDRKDGRSSLDRKRKDDRCRHHCDRDRSRRKANPVTHSSSDDDYHSKRSDSRRSSRRGGSDDDERYRRRPSPRRHSRRGREDSYSDDDDDRYRRRKSSPRRGSRRDRVVSKGAKGDSYSDDEDRRRKSPHRSSRRDRDSSKPVERLATKSAKKESCSDDEEGEIKRIEDQVEDYIDLDASESKSAESENRNDFAADLEEYKKVRENPDSVKVKVLKEEPEWDEYADYGTDNYYCKYCKLTLNSQVTWDSHIRGKRHAKALKALSVHDVARASLAADAFQPKVEPSCSYATHEDSSRKKQLLFPSETKIKCLAPASGYQRVNIDEVSSIQSLCDSIKDNPVPGLQHVQEIKMGVETMFFCRICDAPCQTSSIMPHLTGFKHALQSLVIRAASGISLFSCCANKGMTELINPHQNYKDKPKREVQHKVLGILKKHEERYGREKITVVKDVPVKSEPNLLAPPEDENTLCWSMSNFGVKMQMDDIGTSKITQDQYLDKSSGDFKCIICDSHMNNIAMWEAHVRGKRHIKNVKKNPGEGISKLKFIRAPPDTKSVLLERIKKEKLEGVIVGLSNVQERHTQNGVAYNCFPCGAQLTDVNILEHLYLMKHKTKYLERLESEGVGTSIFTINAMQVSDYYREQLVDEECRKMLDEMGLGEPQVYIPKSSF